VSKVSKNAKTVVFRCINVVDKQRFDISVIAAGGVPHTAFAHLKHKYLVPATFYEVAAGVVVQVSAGAVCDLGTAMRRNKMVFNELTIRALLHNMLRVLVYCEKRITKPFRITLADIMVYKLVSSTSANTWLFKLKNCFYENQHCERYEHPHKLVSTPSSRDRLLADECIVSAVVKLGSIALLAIKNVYGYKAPLELLNNCAYSASLRYVVNCMLHYRSLRSPPTLNELLLFFQTTSELYTEKLRSALFEGVKIKKELFDGVDNCVGRSKSCFF